jgi:hypothetical protein
MKTTTTTRKDDAVTGVLLAAYRVMHAESGYVVGERAASALRLARASLALEEAIDDGTARVRWESEEDGDLSWADKATLARLESGYYSHDVCLLETCCEHGRWSVVASLGGIVHDGSPGYMQTVEAELAMEAGVS